MPNLGTQDQQKDLLHENTMGNFSICHMAPMSTVSAADLSLPYRKPYPTEIQRT